MRKTLSQLVYELKDKVLEVKKVQIVIGRDKKPIPKEGVIIFHIDF